MRTLWISLKLALSTLLLNKLRSALTLLGMIIGVGAVITIVSLGEGLRRQFEGEMSSLGGDVFYMAPKSPKRPGQARRSPSLFTMDDMRAMEENCASIRAVFPGMDAPATVKHRNNTKRSHVQGVYDNFLVAFPNFKLERGRFFTKAELHARARVLVIGDGIADDLFEDAGDPVGKFIKVNGSTYQIVGKMARYSGFVGGPNINTGFYAPITTVQDRILGSDDVFWVTFYMETGVLLADAKEEVARVMRQRRHIRNVTDDDFQFMSPDDFLAIGNQFINVLVGVFGAIAFFSLLVGGVGIMNIMLVSVTERTREIGLRMALGASRSTVLAQFLVEAVVLTLLGGLIGVVTGYLGSVAVAFFIGQVLKTEWTAYIPLLWVGYAVGVSLLIGVTFGVYPAVRASRLNPVEAMRYE